VRCVCREWLVATNQAITQLTPSEMKLDVAANTFPFLTSLDLSPCAYVSARTRVCSSA